MWKEIWEKAPKDRRNFISVLGSPWTDKQNIEISLLLELKSFQQKRAKGGLVHQSFNLSDSDTRFSQHIQIINGSISTGERSLKIVCPRPTTHSLSTTIFSCIKSASDAQNYPEADADTDPQH